MIKIISNSKLIRGLLLSALIWTVPSNFELETVAQAETVQLSSITKQQKEQQDYQELLQKINKLQEAATNYRSEVDQINNKLQEKFNSKRQIKKVNLKPLFQRTEEFNNIWQDFNKELGKKPDLASFVTKIKIEETELIKTINSLEEINRSFNNKTFDEIALYKFALLSTTKATDLQLQVSHIERYVYIELLGLQQKNSLTLDNIDAIAEGNRFFSLKGLLVLLVLSGCAFFIIRQAYNKNNLVKQIKTKEKNNHINKNYDQNTIKSSQPYRQHNNGFSAENKNKQTRAGRTPHYQNPNNNQRGMTDYSSSTKDFINNNIRRSPTRSSYSHSKSTKPPYEQKAKSYFNLEEDSTTNLFPTRTEHQPISKSASPVTHTSDQPNILDEELKAIYHHNPRELLKKVIKVAATRESIEQRRSGFETPITFTETSNDSYWIILEPKSDNGYYLVPKPNLVINSRIHQTIEDIFSCQGYQNRTSNKFKLELFATVQSEGGRSWKLVEPGELLFS
ncbi:MAG: hypothetical protein QNJ55_31625 [Xenococcus sp. MO_188.B8]|nr:hypothetical protein [Xenococcus sp. MO_188.B8]